MFFGHQLKNTAALCQIMKQFSFGTRLQSHTIKTLIFTYSSKLLSIGSGSNILCCYFFIKWTEIESGRWDGVSFTAKEGYQLPPPPPPFLILLFSWWTRTDVFILFLMTYYSYYSIPLFVAASVRLMGWPRSFKKNTSRWNQERFACVFRRTLYNTLVRLRLFSFLLLLPCFVFPLNYQTLFWTLNQ